MDNVLSKIDNRPLLSICIPTNGILDWVSAVLESIYCQNVPQNLFEVVIACNGNEDSFDKFINKVKQKYDNLVYIKTNEQGFMNQVACFKTARGLFVKFLNHRMLMNSNSIEYLIQFIKKYNVSKPPIYFSNGVLKKHNVMILKSFDEFIYLLGIYSSWSNGLAFWNDDQIKKISNSQYNNLFPHFFILCKVTNSGNYIIDDNKLMQEITSETIKKGKYDFFSAFSIEYLSLILELYQKKLIKLKTFVHIKRELKFWLADQCINYMLLKKNTSYDLSGFPKAFTVFYSFTDIIMSVAIQIVKRPIKKLLHCYEKTVIK